MHMKWHVRFVQEWYTWNVWLLSTEAIPFMWKEIQIFGFVPYTRSIYSDSIVMMTITIMTKLYLILAICILAKCLYRNYEIGHLYHLIWMKIFGPLWWNQIQISSVLGAVSNKLNSCDYYIEDTFNDRCKNLPINRCSLSILHLNIRSIPRNLSSQQTYLNNLDIQFSVIGISETWLKPYNVDCYGMDGYKEDHLYRSERMGGGVSLYVMNGIEYMYFVRNDMSIIDEHLESLFIEMDKPCFSNENNSLIGGIYRPPNTDIDIFTNHLITILDKIKLENKSCHLMGDFNINLLNIESHYKTGLLLDILASYSLLPYIAKPMRATEETSTLIDNIFCDNIKENFNTISGILYTDITDHFPIFYIDYSSSVDNTEQFATRRLYSETNKNKLCRQISEYNWNNVLMCTDSQEAFSISQRIPIYL